MNMTEIERALRELRLSGIADTLSTRVMQAQAAQQPFLETLAAMLQDELDRRRSRLMERRFKRSGLAERLTLADFDWRFNPKLPRNACFELHTLKFIGEGANALIVGKPGTGKSHVAKAVAYQATLAGYDVRYVEADTEFARYGLASTAQQAEQLKGWIEPDLLVLDDLFLARRIADVSAELLQAIVHQRYKLRRAIVITSNRVVQDWGKYLADATMATTILDRLMHRCAMLEFEGKSYRLKEAAARIAITPESSDHRGQGGAVWVAISGALWVAAGARTASRLNGAQVVSFA
ncbi:IS21-like element helper ATPase IstB [Variovorax paradoxus]